MNAGGGPYQFQSVATLTISMFVKVVTSVREQTLVEEIFILSSKCCHGLSVSFYLTLPEKEVCINSKTLLLILMFSHASKISILQFFTV